MNPFTHIASRRPAGFTLFELLVVAALDQFLVEGEQRYWVHVAIDRLTGEVIDKQTEVVQE